MVEVARVTVDPSPHSSVLDATACLQSFRTGAKEPARSVSGFSNTLYVYPQALRLPKSKNVALRVRLCDVLDGRTNPIADKSFSRWDDQADDEGSVRSASAYSSERHSGEEDAGDASPPVRAARWAAS